MPANKLPPWRDEYLLEHFQRINAFLQRHQSLWRPQAFQHIRLPWESGAAELALSLRSLSVARAEQLAEDDGALANYLNAWVVDAESNYLQNQLPLLTSANASFDLPEAHAVPGRKWQQIKAFAHCVPPRPTALLEWCAGKAHLGRLLARVQRREVIALEWSDDLVAAGAALALREKLPLHFQCVDVLQQSSAALIQRDHDVIALHACGQLHMQLLHACAKQRPRALILAPCCYHLIACDMYRPLSRSASAAQLALTLADLHTAVRDNVTSPLRVQQQRKTLQAWRLGFDLWQREARGSDSYLPTPSQPLSILKAGFPAFCRELAQFAAIEPPPTALCVHYEQVGWRRLREIAALDLVRILFRRPLELWLVLDRALFLREQGYSVAMGIFCERELTPRNMVLRAERI